MIRFRPIEFIETWALAACIYRHRKLFDEGSERERWAKSPHHDTQSILLRGPPDPSPENWFADDIRHVNYPTMEAKEWVALRTCLQRVRQAVRVSLNQNSEPVMGKAMIVRLKPQGTIDWHTDEGAYAQHHLRYHLPIVTNPACNFYSGIEVMHMPVGQLNYFDNHVPHSAVNFGKSARIHLIVDFRIPEG